MNNFARWYDVLMTDEPYRAEELCDSIRMPSTIRECCQNMLTEQWAHRLPFVQTRSPAFLASLTLNSAIEKAERNHPAPLVVVDFCAGGGGPTPIFEQLINRHRKAVGKDPMKFILTDLYPNPAAWTKVCKKQPHLFFYGKPVDATRAPKSCRSLDSNGPEPMETEDSEGVTAGRKISREDRVFRLFNLAFHHFDDKGATRLLADTMEHSDGIAIIELQDRRLGCLSMMFFNGVLALLVTVFWFWPLTSRASGKRKQNLLQIFLTYTGILPFVLWYDGLASCLRTREFAEVMRLAAKAQGLDEHEHESPAIDNNACEIGEWQFSMTHERHTWPFCYMNCIVGTRKFSKEREDSVAEVQASSSSSSKVRFGV
ncbi:hypothetical protein K491DRAFT_425890 [Lophiostoma macrostomum CBS 122681]|uniref:Uncharacterized protein n=1 Tax=Lophiostoma macrostomum CBS 122681 TaxID=1314788 RepID=A0A6A6TA98_9PLEO|nr:hypothetical protein K491DRAFT_425890 [Lophiostoma macrostomum CBS 122681]